jgi:hypothetical protein
MEDDLSELKSWALQHAFFKAFNAVLIGNPDGPFATYDETRKELLIFGGIEEKVTQANLLDTEATLPLQIAYERKASFYFDNENVICEIGQVTAAGSSYAEAAIRALLKTKKHENQATNQSKT